MIPLQNFLFNEEDARVRIYFEKLGYTVSWDFQRSTGKAWHEILDGGKIICQIDIGIPIEAIVEDFTCEYHGKPGTSAPDYVVSGTERYPELFRKLLAKIVENPVERLPGMADPDTLIEG